MSLYTSISLSGRAGGFLRPPSRTYPAHFASRGTLLPCQMQRWANATVGKCDGGQMQRWANATVGKCNGGQMQRCANATMRIFLWTNVDKGGQMWTNGDKGGQM